MAIVYIACEAFLYGIAFLWLAAIIIKAGIAFLHL